MNFRVSMAQDGACLFAQDAWDHKPHLWEWDVDALLVGA